MTRDENNRKLAEWLGMIGEWPDGSKYGYWPDFYTDEAANALLLEKMPMARVERIHSRWVVYSDWRFKVGIDGDAIDADRKTAICEAALALIESHDKERQEQKP